MLLHGLSATRRNVRPGLAPPPARGWRVIAYDARGHGAVLPGPRRTSTPTWSTTSRAVLDDLELERVGAGGQLDGRGHRHGVRAGAPERVAALVQITPAYDGARAHRRGRSGRLGADGRRARAGRTWTRSWTWQRPTGAGEGWREVAREADQAAHGAPRAPGGGRARRCARCRARPPGTAWRRWSGSRCPCWSSAPATRWTTCTRWRSPQEYADRLPNARAGGRGGGQVAARLAGRPAVDGDRGLPRAGGLPARALVEHASRAARSSRPPRTATS